MFNFCRLGVQALVTVALLAGVMGCGSVSNNDQGVSFLSLGYFADGDGDAGDAGRVVLLNRDWDLDGAAQFLAEPYMGLENRLSKQYIRVIRIDCEYDVPGADPMLDIPDHTFNMSSIINGTDDGTTDEEANTQLYSQFIMISPDIYSFLSVNQNLLPELPFQMTVICRAVGVTEAGDVLTTNDAPYQMIVAERQEGVANSATEATAFNTGPGTGGTPTTSPISETASADQVVATTAAEFAVLEDEYL